ncbi:hypothetical protein C8R46DRAFT_1036424 [Mycena filopes]|nr:hypothetical protein C8R46DRAFT_1036424 [Mycena filopes]
MTSGLLNQPRPRPPGDVHAPRTLTMSPRKPPQDRDFVKRAWGDACTEFEAQLPLTSTIYKLIAARAPQLRGEMKTKVKPLAETMYGFRSGHDKKTVTFNRKRAESLKEESRFTMKDVKAKKGLFKHAILQKACNTTLTLAALITVNTIDKYLTGIRTNVPFTANDYCSVYQTHLRALQQFEEHTAKYNLFNTILVRMHNIARFYSGAQLIAEITTAVLSTVVLDAAIKEFKEDSDTETDEYSANLQSPLLLSEFNPMLSRLRTTV